MWEKGEDKEGITKRRLSDGQLEQCECSEGRRKGQGQSGLWESALNAMLKNLVLRWKAFKWLRNIMMFVESQLVEGCELVKKANCDLVIKQKWWPELRVWWNQHHQGACSRILNRNSRTSIKCWKDKKLRMHPLPILPTHQIFPCASRKKSTGF